MSRHRARAPRLTTVRIEWARALAPATLGLLLTAGAAQGAGPQREVHLAYDFFAGGFRVGVVSATARIGGETYAAEARFVTEGTLGALFPVDFRFASAGSRAGDSTRPERFQSVYGGIAGNPVVNVAFAQDAGPARVEPALPTGASLEDIAAAGRLIDPVAAAVEAFTREGPNACGRTIRIFDGIRTYALKLGEESPATVASYSGSLFSGTAIRCTWRYRLEASARGDWARDLFGENPPDGEIWFAPTAEGGVMVPVKFLARTPIVHVVVHLMRAEENGSPVALNPAGPPRPDEG